MIQTPTPRAKKVGQKPDPPGSENVRIPGVSGSNGQAWNWLIHYVLYILNFQMFVVYSICQFHEHRFYFGPFSVILISMSLPHLSGVGDMAKRKSFLGGGGLFSGRLAINYYSDMLDDDKVNNYQS